MRRIHSLLVFILLGLICMESAGQRYVYPIATGTSWSREQFRTIDSLDRITLKAGASSSTSEILAFFDRFDERFETYHNYNDSIYVVKENAEEWMNLVNRRAERFAVIYNDNNNDIDLLMARFSGNNVPEIEYEALYYGLRRMYDGNIHDNYLVSRILEVLIPHYENLCDSEHLMLCYSVAGLINYELYRLGLPEKAALSAHYYFKALKLGDHFRDFSSPLNRYYFIASYVNLAVLHNEIGTITTQMAHRMGKEIPEMLSRTENARILKEDANLLHFATWANSLIKMKMMMSYISSGVDDRELFFDLYMDYHEACRHLGKGGVKDPNYRYYSILYYDDLLLRAYAGEISWDEALEGFLPLTDPDSKFSHSTLRVNYLYNLFISFQYVVERSSAPEDRKAALIREFVDILLDNFISSPHIQFPIERGMILSLISTNEGVLKCYDGPGRLRLLDRLLILGHPSTFIHQSMTAGLTEIFTSRMIDVNPEYFVGVPGYDCVEDVLGKRDSLISFASQAAYYHDIGKLTMMTLTDNCLRRLSTEELDIIRLHPQKSELYLKSYPSLQPYRDVLLGHHKSFLGLGYPESFNNRQSPYFPIINIVQICDCLDAATEVIGRNYHKPKDFDTVIKEFERDRAVIYDPVLVDAIKGDTVLYGALKYKLQTGRPQQYDRLISSLHDN